MHSPERRRHPRVELVGRVESDARSPHASIALLNISPGGFMIQTTMHYAIGETHTFRIHVAEKPVVVVQGRIAHTMRVTAPELSSFLYGVECADEQSSRALESLLAPPSDTPS